MAGEIAEDQVVGLSIDQHVRLLTKFVTELECDDPLEIGTFGSEQTQPVACGQCKTCIAQQRAYDLMERWSWE